MSLIETAIKKIQASAAAQQAQTQAQTTPPAPPAPRTGVTQRKGPARVEPVDPSSVRQFKRVSTDPEAMERNCILPQISDHAALRAYKILRTRISQRLAANSWHSLAITGTESGQGKTLTAINLAMAMAQDPSTYVFLVDLDLQRPQIGNYLGMQFDKGLGDYLAGEAGINDIIYNQGVERLAIIPNGRPLEHSSDYLSSPRMLTLQEALNAETPRRIIIYDMPPLLLSDDVITFAPRVDGVILVVTEGITARGSVERSKELLAEMNLVGVVLNRSTERNDSAYY